MRVWALFPFILVGFCSVVHAAPVEKKQATEPRAGGGYYSKVRKVGIFRIIKSTKNPIRPGDKCLGFLPGFSPADSRRNQKETREGDFLNPEQNGRQLKRLDNQLRHPSDPRHRLILETTKFLFETGFNAREPIWSRDILGPNFFPRLQALGPNQHWINVGSGRIPKLERAYLHNKDRLLRREKIFFEGPKAKVTGLGTEILTKGQRDLIRRARRQGDSYEYLGGKFVEKYKPGEIEPADLLTDQYGALAYTSKLNQVIRAELQLLKEGGVLVSHFDPNTKIVDKEGNDRTREWLESIRGAKPVDYADVKSEVKDKQLVYHQFTLQRTSGKLRIPRVTCVGYEETPTMNGADVRMPPTRVFLWESYRPKR